MGDVSLGMWLHTSRLVGKLKAITSDIGRGHSGYHQQRHSSTHCWRPKYKRRTGESLTAASESRVGLHEGTLLSDPLISY